MRKLILVALAALLPLTARAETYFYDHNGSQMRVNVEGSVVRIVYERPRPGLESVGVRPGTLLFDGKFANDYLEGMSRVFNANCGEVDYFVYGDFKPGHSFKLSGAAPVLSNMSCRIVDNVYEGPNANLDFTALRGTSDTHVPAPRTGCVTGVKTTLNVRVGPGPDYGRIGELEASSCDVEVLARCQDDWCLVRQGSVTGWVSMRYIRK